jgi:hypothetical protein
MVLSLWYVSWLTPASWAASARVSIAAFADFCEGRGFEPPVDVLRFAFALAAINGSILLTVKQAAQERKAQGRPKGGKKLPQQIGEDTDKHAGETPTIRAKTAGTNRTYIDLADKLVKERVGVAKAGSPSRPLHSRRYTAGLP